MQLISLKKKYGGVWFENKSLYDLTWLRLKGTYAKHLWIPTSSGMIAKFLSEQKMSYIILGNGSNMILDNFSGVIIKMSGLSGFALDGDSVIAGAGLSNKILITKCLHGNKCGFEFLYTIPGSIGGAVCMNAGAHGDCIANHIKWVEVINKKTSEIQQLTPDQIIFDYRYSSLHESYIVTRVALTTRNIDNDTSKDKSIKFIHEIEEYVNTKQPRSNTLGSTFKNPGNIPAWKLLNEMDPEDLMSTNIYFSDLHRNFMINRGEATAQEAYELITSVQKKVFDKAGINLEFEIKVFLDGQ